ncbi:asparagine synthase (glutamine-hydrolyzing) [Natranaerofaba carboxydovora]|uniref:asparagine synthase (glutamine-hydrolyzing) n=1 Tax=Natranaerofaba carboxydovora TaxID=2742683 RepID=UPI001F13DED8|nr:asparagine synthase (glutamine-hydrolyzing) [Natranaerofaba carboxydovora]UMZ73818.1 Asparagine synthetase [glutamine-hydrolyzing] 3 [Natranaerofaba carboxydovora]
MCGIVGWLYPGKDMSEEKKEIKKMTGRLMKRGPDDFNIWSNQNIAFGHTRLEVVDPEFGKQPMTKKEKDSTYTIVYNGELYNTEEIRRKLKNKGYKFNSHSDTEVLLTSYIEWEEECLEILNGIFAFAIWHERKKRLFLARDRLGVKPLFYSNKNNSFFFASEPKALLENRLIDTSVDLEGLRDVFALSPSRTPGCGIFEELDELRPAHAMICNLNKEIKMWRYWQVKSKPHNKSIKDTALDLHDLLQDTVRRQLVADVPVCTFLSGGIDSSILTAFTAEAFERDNKNALKTYSIDYENNDKYFTKNSFQPEGDMPWIRLVSETFGTKHKNKIISINELTNYLKRAVYARDMPGMADIDSSLLWFCEKVKKDATVALSGECADEIFGGYPWFYKEELMNRPYFPWMDSIKDREYLLNNKWKEKLKLEEYIRTKYNETLKETPYLDGENKAADKRREISYLNIIWFMTTLLDRKDRMSMDASLEVRVPFADHRLVEYVWNIPWEMKQKDDTEKWILRKATEDVLPHKVLYRKKNPYPKTHNPIYKNIVASWVDNEVLQDKNAPILEFMDKNNIKELVTSKGDSMKTPFFGQLMSGPQLLAHLGQVNTWLKDYNITIKK